MLPKGYLLPSHSLACCSVQPISSPLPAKRNKAKFHNEVPRSHAQLSHTSSSSSSSCSFISWYHSNASMVCIHNSRYIISSSFVALKLAQNVLRRILQPISALIKVQFSLNKFRKINLGERKYRRIKVQKKPGNDTIWNNCMQSLCKQILYFLPRTR